MNGELSQGVIVTQYGTQLGSHIVYGYRDGSGNALQNRATDFSKKLYEEMPIHVFYNPLDSRESAVLEGSLFQLPFNSWFVVPNKLVTVPIHPRRMSGFHRLARFACSPPDFFSIVRRKRFRCCASSNSGVAGESDRTHCGFLFLVMVVIGAPRAMAQAQARVKEKRTAKNGSATSGKGESRARIKEEVEV
jgi:hypothetical protein